MSEDMEWRPGDETRVVDHGEGYQTIYCPDGAVWHVRWSNPQDNPHPNRGTTVMSEININLVRQDLHWLKGSVAVASKTADRALSALDHLAKENERLTKEWDEGDRLIKNAREVGCEMGLTIGSLTRERDEARTKLEAMQEAIVEAVTRIKESTSSRSADGRLFREWLSEPLRSHLPTPEPETVDPLVEVFRSLPLHGDAGCDKLTDAEWVMVAEAARNTLEVRKIGEGAA